MKFKYLIFDFDGVLVESNTIRIEGFRHLFQDYPKNEVAQLMNYVEKNGGISRYVKIQYFFETIRNESLRNQDLQSWADRYSKLVKERVIQAESVKGSEDFFSIYGKQFQSTIVSGSDQKELRRICQARNIDQYFVEILGSPVDKSINISHVIKTNGWEKSQCVYIGDSHNDLEAAMANNITFLGRKSGITDWTNYSVDSIQNFNELYEFLRA